MNVVDVGQWICSLFKRLWARYFRFLQTCLWIFLGLVVFLMAWFGVCVDGFYHRPMTHQALILRLEQGMSAQAMVQCLHQQRLITSPSMLLLWIRARGWSHHLKKGIYQVQADETAIHFVRRVMQGDVWMQTWRIAEGATLWQITKQLQNIPYLSHVEPDWSVLSNDHLNAEGMLLADTYHFPAGSATSFLLKQAHGYLSMYLNRAWMNRDPSLPYKTPYELLISASIIEKEAAIPQERQLISGIIVNRLHLHMPLQMDPIVIYGLGPEHQGRLTHQDLQIDSLYNAYKHRGLPPTPIAMVGISALEAAAHPLKSDFLYFVANGDGTHHFSVTYAEQRAAIRRVKKRS